jgi:prepilin-type N-terminal cleavage/methylation domain-containing protein
MPIKLQSTNKSSGYTLIEILVALSIIGLIFGVGYVNFRDFSRRQALSSTARSIKGDLRLAQEEALTGKKPSDAANKCVNPSAAIQPTLSGYGFKIINSHTYAIEAVCSGGNVEVKRVTLPSDMSITSASAEQILFILFKVLGQGTNIATTTTIYIVQQGTGSTATITVSKSGEIK